MAVQQSLLWKISSSLSPEASYVFGTMHVKDRKAFRYYDLVCEKIEACDAFCTEFDFATTDPIATQQAMMLPAGVTIDQLIRPKVYQKIRKMILKATDLDLLQFNNSLPLLFNNLLSERILSEDMPFSLDENLWQYAEGAGKTLLGVESFSEQLRIMSSIPLDHQIKALIWTGKNFSRFRKQLLKTVQLYEKGDLRQLHRSAKKSLHGLRKLLLYQRNFNMADRIIELMQSQTIVVAIGAGHLAGGKGVLRLLKQQGCKVNPVGD